MQRCLKAKRNKMHPVLLENIKEIGKPYSDLHFLLECLAEVLEENNEKELITYIPWLSPKVSIPTEKFEQKTIHLYSISFQLLNLCEVNWAVQSRRNKQQEQGADSVNGSWAHTFSELKDSGFSQDEIVDALSQIGVEPVLTAHPTEAKRTVVLKYYRELYLQLVMLENPMYTELERSQIRSVIKEILTRLWFIDDIYLEKPKVETELDNVLHYLTNVFPDVFELHDRTLHQAWSEAGFQPEVLNSYRNMPKITLGTWVGGDRDGHPLVTPEITRYTLIRLRTEALSLVRQHLLLLADSLSIYTSGNIENAKFVEMKTMLQQQIPGIAENTRFTAASREPFKQYVLLLAEKLPIRQEPLTGISLLTQEDWTYTNSHQLLNDIDLLMQALSDWGAPTLAVNEVDKVSRFVQNFGFHLAHLDVRQNSAFYQKAFIGLLEDVDRSGNPISSDGSPNKDFLLNELSIYRPFTYTYSGEIPETNNALGYLGVLSAHVRKYGSNALGSMIVSMTRKVDDLFTVYLWRGKPGCMKKHQTARHARFRWFRCSKPLTICIVLLKFWTNFWLIRSRKIR